MLAAGSLETAVELAELLRVRIAELQFNGLRVTASYGVSCGQLGVASCQELLEQADKSLYHSKHNGRNRVTDWGQASVTFNVQEPQTRAVAADQKSTAEVAELTLSGGRESDLAQLAEIAHEILTMSPTVQPAQEGSRAD